MNPHRAALQVLGIAATIGLWAVLWQTGVLPNTSVASPAATWNSLERLVVDSGFWSQVSQTFTAWILALVIALAIAIPFGVLVGMSDAAHRVTRVVVESIRPIPPVVILPLAVLILGIGIEFKAALIVQGALWPLFIQTSYGVRNIDVVVVETMRTYHVGLGRRIALVRIPAAASQIAAGLRLSAATAFAVCLVTEIIGGAHGLGAAIVSAQVGGDIAGVMALTCVAGVFGMLISLVFGRLERAFLAWTPSRGQT